MANKHGRNNVLYGQCRAGDAEALVACVYQISDELYAAARQATGSDRQASEVVSQTWDQLLQALKRWRFGGHLHTRTFHILQRILASAVGPEAAQQAVDSVQSASVETAEAGVAAPEELVAELVGETHKQAPNIARAARARRRRTRVALAASGLLAVAIISVGVGLYGQLLQANNPQVRFACLQQRISEDHLVAALRDASAQLAYAEGGEELQAHAYHRTGLVLEEIVNAAGLADLNHLYYIKQRIDSEELTEAVRAAAWDSSGPTRQDLMHIALVLEEVESW